MKILIVEDDHFKSSQLERKVADLFFDAQVSRANSLQEAMSTIHTTTFNYVLLDMAIPSHSSDSGTADIYSQPVGGLDILLYLAFGNRSEKVVILTQYPTVEYNREHVQLHNLKDKLSMDGVDNVYDVILFADDGHWRAKLEAVLENQA